MKKEKQSLNFTISSMTKANLYITCGSIAQKRSLHLWIRVCHFCGILFVSTHQTLTDKAKVEIGDIYHIPQGYACLPSSGLEGGPQLLSLV